MSKYYRYNRVLNEYVPSAIKKGGRYMYDPVTDSYVENIATVQKESYLHSKYGHYGFHDFYMMLNEMMAEELPSFDYKNISYGDYTFDEETEIVYKDKTLRYSPYAMFILSQSTDDTIICFLNMCRELYISGQWEKWYRGCFP